MASLEEIRQKLLAKQNQGERKGSGGDNAFYPFWNIPENTTAIFRFLPDADPNNTFFWVEAQKINLTFSGIKGEHSNPVTIRVPCMEMYGKPCPILTEIRPWWKDPDLEGLARQYWRKKSYIFQGFVVDDPLNEENKPENPIRRFVINPSIYTIIESSLIDPEMEDLPTDYNNGRDFRLRKTKKGQYADYSTSKWSMGSRSLDDAERQAIDTYGVFNLKDFLPKEPDDEQLEIIKAMFEASVEGEPYDPVKFNNYMKPGSYNNNSNSNKTTVAAPKPQSKAAPKVEEEEDTPPFNVDEEESSSNAADALAKLKSRISTGGNEEEPAAETKSDGKKDPQEILKILRQRTRK